MGDKWKKIWLKKIVENMGEIEKAGMQQEAVRCGVAAGKRVTCNLIKNNQRERMYCKVLQGRTAKQNIKNKYKRYGEERGEEKGRKYRLAVDS